jgi:hypothetical protein
MLLNGSHRFTQVVLKNSNPEKVSLSLGIRWGAYIWTRPGARVFDVKRSAKTASIYPASKSR